MIDSHCHVNTDRFAEDREAVLDRARAAGVDGMIIIGAAGSLDLCRSAIAMAEQDEGIWATVGVHPHDAKVCTPDIYAEVEQMAAHEQVVAVGETGLDYYYDTSTPEQQQVAYREFVRMARRCGKPLVFHVRDAHADAIAIAKEERAADCGGVVHCFTGTYDEAQAWLDLGFHLGITGIVTFRNAGDLPRVVADAPMERLLIETDSPYLSPVPHRGKRNEPAFVRHVAEKVADLKGLTVDQVDRATDGNTRRLFRL